MPQDKSLTSLQCVNQCPRHHSILQWNWPTREPVSDIQHHPHSLICRILYTDKMRSIISPQTGVKLFCGHLRNFPQRHLQSLPCSFSSSSFLFIFPVFVSNLLFLTLLTTKKTLQDWHVSHHLHTWPARHSNGPYFGQTTFRWWALFCWFLSSEHRWRAQSLPLRNRDTLGVTANLDECD